jgi:hypothetical protein
MSVHGCGCVTWYFTLVKRCQYHENSLPPINSKLKVSSFYCNDCGVHFDDLIGWKCSSCLSLRIHKVGSTMSKLEIRCGGCGRFATNGKTCIDYPKCTPAKSFA